MNNKDFNAEESFKSLEDKFLQADKFAQHLINSLKKSKEADEEIKKIIRKLIKEDIQCRNDIKDISREYYKEKEFSFYKHIAWKIITVLVLPTFFIVIGVIIRNFFDK
jgi:hypothetical protein